MLRKKFRRKKRVSKENKRSSDNNSKIKNNKSAKKWFKYYNHYPGNYIMSIRDANILAFRLRNNTSQGILKAEKKAFYNFFEFIKKSSCPKRADEFEDLFAVLKNGNIKTVYNYNDDFSIEEKSDSDNSYLDIKRENEKILLSLEKSEKIKENKIDNFLEKSNEEKSKVFSLKNKDNKTLKFTENEKKNKIQDEIIPKNDEIKDVVYDKNEQKNTIKDKKVINKSIQLIKEILEKDQKGKKNNSKDIKNKKYSNNIDNFNNNNKKTENDGKTYNVNKDEIISSPLNNSNSKENQTKKMNENNVSKSNKHKKGKLENEAIHNLFNEDEVYDINDNLEDEKKIKLPFKESQESFKEDDKKDEKIEVDKKDLPVYNRQGKIIEKKTIIEFVKEKNIKMLENLIFPNYNYSTFKYNFGKIPYKKWIKLHIKCEFCTNEINLEYCSYHEHLVKFHLRKMNEKCLVPELKQKKILEKLFVKQFIKYKKIENDLLAINLYYRTLRGKTYGVYAKMTEEYMEIFKKYKSVSVGKSLDILESRMKGIITQRNTTRKKKEEKE